MNKIGNIGQILGIIRSQTKAGISKQKNGKESSAEINAASSIKRISRDELKNNIIRKLKSAPKNADTVLISKDVFLESVMLWEFGEQLANDPLFTEIRNKVRQAIDNNPDASKKLEKLIQQLSVN